MEIEYSEDGKVLIGAYDIKGHFTIPNTVEKIGYMAFSNCKVIRLLPCRRNSKKSQKSTPKNLQMQSVREQKRDNRSSPI